MATHTRYPEIKKWAESTGRRSVQLWLPQDAVLGLDRLCQARGVKRAAMLSALIEEAAGPATSAENGAPDKRGRSFREGVSRGQGASGNVR